MAGVIKEYLPKTILLWEKTYGKGSVQTIYEYPDLSSLKLTIAKRYTGKDHINIDGTGLKVDIEVLPITGDSLNGIDRQLDAAKKIP
jgi:carboxyl-terminal processing protease